MSDLSAVRYEAESAVEQVSTSWVDEARTFFAGFLFTALVTVVGAALVTVALVVGVVGAPIIAAGVAYAIYRSRRAAKVRAFAT